MRPSDSPTAQAETPALVGRDVERARIGELLARAREERSGALVVSGEPGIGKSALCAWAVAQAAGIRVLSVRGIESDADLPFAGLSDLFAGESDRFHLLPGPRFQPALTGRR